MDKHKYYGKDPYKGKYPHRKKEKSKGELQKSEDDNWYYK